MKYVLGFLLTLGFILGELSLLASAAVTAENLYAKYSSTSVAESAVTSANLPENVYYLHSDAEQQSLGNRVAVCFALTSIVLVGAVSVYRPVKRRW